MCVILKKTITYIHSFLQQVQKIRQLLKKGKFEDIDVGSVEEFQGQERLIIIVSTVRCNPEYLSLDFKHNLGFLRNPKVKTRLPNPAKDWSLFHVLLCALYDFYTLHASPFITFIGISSFWVNVIDFACRD